MRADASGMLRHFVAGVVVTVFAGAADPAGAAGPIEEIVVTATKREQSLQDVPISIGVVTGETIEKFRVEDIRDLTNYMPNFSAQHTFGNWVVRIRGIGSGPTNLAFDSSVSVFSDGIYCGRSRCLETAFMDLQRAEVARGPQGALFGKSTVAGALSVHSARPTETFESYVRGGYEFENAGHFGTAMVSGPITDTVRGRLVGIAEKRGGFVKNTFTGDDEPETNRWAARGSLEWDVTDTLSAFFKAEYFDTRVDGNSNQLVRQGGVFAGLTQDPNAEFVRNTRRHVSTGNSDEDFDDSKSKSFTLQLDQALGEHSLSLIAGHWDLEYENWLDVDGVPENFLTSGLGEEFDQQSLELRLLSPTGNSFEYIVGALYYTSYTKTRQYSPFGFFPPIVAPVPVGSDRNFHRNTDTYSVYGQATWNVSDTFRVIADLRYTEEEQDGYGFSFPITFPDGRNPVYTPGAFNQPREYRFFQTREDESLDPSLRVQYDASDNVMLYAAYATGSKPGGLKANDATLGNQLFAKNSDPAFLERYIGQPSVTAPELAAGINLKQGNGIFDFEDESAENYEVGAKVVLADGRAVMNLAIFHMEFDNLQTGTYDGTQFIIKNAGSARINGIELEGTWQATDTLSLSGGLGYLDHEYKDFAGAQCIVIDVNGTFANPACVDGQQNLAGEPLERTPDWELTLTADWERELAPGIVGRATLGMYYNDGYDVREDYHPLGRQKAFTKWDARIGVANSDDTWEIALLGRNLTDEHIIQHAYEIAGGDFQSFSDGRTAMLQGTYRF
ncbi:MAG: TonB-dependent receptor [Pseudomonadales bacterium]|nr:TonB-dependent receptor [Pseudomonadales bacterium]